MKTRGFPWKSVLRNPVNLLRYRLIRKDPLVTDGAAHGDVPEQAPEEATSYRSPWRVLARAFEKSRDLWKAKYKGLQQRIKAFRTEMRDLRRSRDRWRAKAEALEQEARRTACPSVQRQVEQSPPAPSRRSQPALTRLSS